VITVPVPVGDRSYDVLVGDGARHQLPAVLPTTAKRVAVVTQAGVPSDIEVPLEHKVFTLDQGEEHKSLATIEELCRGFTSWGMTRSDCVVGIGGGVVTDVAGFAAAVYHRGIPVVHVATSLLAMVDAAIGGKTGVNLPEGKNLVGAFWQPSAVLCDTELLTTLPPREWACGQGEMAKYHFLTGDDLLSMPLGERIARCVAIKAEVVASDERESGRRALLNYGHTLAHALEIEETFDLRHGEAVAIGLVYAAEVARTMERIGTDRVDEHRRVVESYGLSHALPHDVDVDALITLMARDKKALDGITFVLDGPQGLEVVPGIDRSVLERAFAAMERT
jgi:5-deoxy-5-amino-3-dehydroquinate synthase